jgi:hypothetical protein
MQKIPKIGKRGWLGIALFAAGLMTLIGAGSQAETETEQSNYENGVYVGGLHDGIAKDAGYGSFNDYLANQNRKSGLFFMCFGAGLAGWGFWRYGRQNPRGEQPQGNDSDKPAA